MRDLGEVDKEGIEIDISGHLLENLAFNLGYTYQDWDYDGQYLEAAEELSDRADHRFNGGLRYTPFENTLIMMDYRYQDEQIAHIQEEDPPDSGNIISYENPMNSYQVFDLAIEQRLIHDQPSIKDLRVKLFINNLTNERYEEERGFPMTDRTFGVALKGSF